MGPGPWTEGEDREGEASERTTMLSSRSGIERERERKVRGKSSSKQTTAVGRSWSYDTRMLNPCWIAFLDRLLTDARLLLDCCGYLWIAARLLLDLRHRGTV